MTSNQTFAGMIAEWPHDKIPNSGRCHHCQAQALLDRLRGLEATFRERADAADKETGIDGHDFRQCALELNAILGPEQAGERTSR
jgi:hypothetical protein